jgi:hypothetical protein
MTERQVFYSFHHNDMFRVQQIRNIGVKAIIANDWEGIKGENSIKKWIDDNMKYCSCAAVLIGEYTANRKWVKYEIEKAFKE